MRALVAQMAGRVIYEETWDPLSSHMPVPLSQMAPLRATYSSEAAPTPHAASPGSHLTLPRWKQQ